MTTKQNEGVPTVTNFAELEGLKVKELKDLLATLKAEDEENELLNSLNAKSKKADMVEVIAQHLGFVKEETEDVEIEGIQLTSLLEQPNVDNPDDIPPVEKPDGMYYGDDAYLNPELNEPVTTDEELDVLAELNAPTPNQEELPEGTVVGGLAEQPTVFDTDSILAELGLDSNGDDPFKDVPSVTTTEVPLYGPALPPGFKEKKPEKPKKPKTPRVTIPMDAPIPVVQFRNLLIGVYGNILEEREEPFPAGHSYEGCKHEEIKLERFNAKAHETFRNTKGRMVLLSTQNGSTYLVVAENPDGTREAVIEVTNRGRGCLRCKQLANMLQLAYIEKKDAEFISYDDYTAMKETIQKYEEPKVEQEIQEEEAVGA